MLRIVAALIAALFISAPLAAGAQVVPGDQGYQDQGGPSYAEGADQAYSGDEQLHGRIVSFDGAYGLQVRDEKGYVDNIQLHQGTIINPTGLTLAPGMIVSIMGYNAGPFFAANEIDTPYTYTYGVPYYAGHPWNYYGPSVSLSFFFGNPGWWHGNFFVGRPRFVGGARVYDNVRVNNFYRGGTFQGHNYVVPRERGGYVAHGAPARQEFHGAPQGRAEVHSSGGDRGGDHHR
jgi:hypothetical protein